jgi:hypothetical protein
MAEHIGSAPVRQPRRLRRPRDTTHFVVSGGGGTALCSHFRDADGAISGRVLQAFDPVDGRARLTFGTRAA